MVPMELLRSELLICHFTPPEPPDPVLSLSHHQAIPLPVNPPPSHPLEPPDPPDPPDLLSSFHLSCSVSKISTHPPPPTSALALPSVMLAKVAGVHCSDPFRFTTDARSLAVFIFCFGELHGISLLFHANYSILGYFSWIWFWYPLSDLPHTREWFIGVSISPAVLATVPSLVNFDSVWAAKNHVGVLFQAASFTSPFIIIVQSSSISPSFDLLKLLVLLLAGEGTSGYWIPVSVNFHILVRRCKILGVTHEFSIARSLPGPLCIQQPTFPELQLVWAQPNSTKKGLQFSSWIPSGQTTSLLGALGVRICLAVMFSSTLLWKMFNISTSSIGLERSFPSSSFLKERRFPPCSLSMKEFYFSDSIPETFVDLVTILFSCVLVRLGPEETTEFISVTFGGEDWLSKSRSKVTIIKQSSFAVKCCLTHASLNNSFLLSYFFEVLSVLSVVLFMLICINLRGCFIPSSCSLEV